MYSSLLLHGKLCLSLFSMPNQAAHRADELPGFKRETSLSEMVLFKYKYVYKGTSNNSSFLANKIFNTLLNEPNKTKK